MSSILKNFLWMPPAVFAAIVLSAGAVLANPILEDNSSSIEQVTSVSQLSDVQPTDWAFGALQSLVERYGCIAGLIVIFNPEHNSKNDTIYTGLIRTTFRF